MDVTPSDVETVHLGQWLTIPSLRSLIPEQAKHYQRRLGRYHIGSADDLAQAAEVAMLVWEQQNPTTDRIRELVGLSLLHRAMVDEVRANRKQSSGGGKLDAPERTQLSDKQVEMINLFSMHAAKAARKPLYEMTYLKKALGWSDEAISRYYSRKKDERRYWSPEQIAKMVKTGVRRIKRKVPP
jgi:hypothetical protein